MPATIQPVRPKSAAAKQEWLEPLGCRVLVLPDAAESITPGGIVLPDAAQEKPSRGTVRAVGPDVGLPKAGEQFPALALRSAASKLREGDVVLYGKYAGSKLVLGDQELLIMSEEDVLGRIILK